MKSPAEKEHNRLSLAFVVIAVGVIVSLANDPAFWRVVERMLLK